MSEVYDIAVDEISTSYPTIPAGAYRIKIAGAYSKYVTDPKPDEGKISWTLINVPCEVLKPQENVNSEELEEFGSVRSFRLIKKFFVPTEADKPENKVKKERFQRDLRRFLLQLGGALPKPGTSLLDWLDASIQKEFIGDVERQPKHNDPTEFENEIRKTYAVSKYPNAK